MNKKIVMVLVIITVLFAGFFLVKMFTGKQEPELIERINDLDSNDLLDTMSIDLFEVNESGQSGFVTIDNYGYEVRIVIQLIDDLGVTRSANIRSGSCDNPGEIVNNLNNVIDGRSETKFDLLIDEITGGSPFVIAVFESESDLGEIIVCGEK